MDRKDYFVGQFEDFMFEADTKGATKEKRKDEKEE